MLIAGELVFVVKWLQAAKGEVEYVNMLNTITLRTVMITDHFNSNL